MNTKTIHILVASIYLLVMGFGILIGQKIKPEQKSDSQEPTTWDYIILNSGETFTIEEEPSIWHSGFLSGDYRQEIVQEAYQLGGLEFVSLIECENGQWITGAVGDYGKSHWLCMLDTRRHKEPLSPSWNDWRNQISVCFERWKSGTKFYWPQRLIWGKRCWEAVKTRFYFM